MSFDTDHLKGRMRNKAQAKDRVTVSRRGNNLFKSENGFFTIFVEKMDLAHIKD